MSRIGKDSGKRYSFRIDPDAGPYIKKAGIDLVSLANNHTWDYGLDSLCQTNKELDKMKIAHVGAGCNEAEAKKPHTFYLGDNKIGFLAYADFYKDRPAKGDVGGMAKFDLNEMKIAVKKLKKEVDIVVVSFHWGVEYDLRSSSHQQNIAKTLVDVGADIIVGHHPHVRQEIEKYKNGWIIYSLGNFVFGQDWGIETMKGMFAEVLIQDKKVLNINPYLVKINKNYQPEIIKKY